jgi:hypothetical protein
MEFVLFCSPAEKYRTYDEAAVVLPAVFEVRASIPDPAFGWLQSKDILYK